MPDVVSQLRTAPVAPVARGREIALAWSLEGSAVAVALLASGLVEDPGTRRDLERRARHNAFESDLMGVRDGVVRLAATRLSLRDRVADAAQEGRLALLQCLRSYNWRIARLDVFAAPAVARAVLRAGGRIGGHDVALTPDLVDELGGREDLSVEDAALSAMESATQAAGVAQFAALLSEDEAAILGSWAYGVVVESADTRSLEGPGASGAARRQRIAALLRHPGVAGRRVGPFDAGPGACIPGDTRARTDVPHFSLTK
ncbi:MAG: hypothetical protein M0Z95_02405 [Actinomycetota bacterium]|nr:hypothetical protein [Actinomycetota bacterium]